jgi:hypothetical protein
METTNNSRNDNRNPRTLVIGAIAGVLVATALGGAFLLGGRAGGSSTTTAEGQVLPSATPTPQTAGRPTGSTSQPQQPADDAPQNGDGAPQQPQTQDEEPVATETPVIEEEDEDPTETPSATPTATKTPWGPDDLAAESTPTSTPDPCPLCNDLELVGPIDVEPIISNISTSFCFPTLAVLFDLSFADVVWFSFTSDGATHQSQHIDADTFLGFLTKDMGYLGWDVYFISNLRIHATDDEGNHVWSDQIDIPDPDLAC